MSEQQYPYDRDELGALAALIDAELNHIAIP